MTRAELVAALKLDKPLAFFDVESTGKYPDRDRIVEITILTLWPNGTETRFASLVNPTVPIPAEVSAIHGITDAMVRDEPTFRMIAPGIVKALQGADLGGYNIRRFDVPILVAELARATVRFSLEGRRLIDPCVIFHKREPRDLAAALQFFCGRALDGAHRADADVAGTIDVLAGQLDRYADLPRSVAELHAYGKDPSWIDESGRVVWISGVACLGFGVHAGRPLESMAAEPASRDYLRWMLSKDFPADVKAICKAALDGKFPKEADAAPAAKVRAIA